MSRAVNPLSNEVLEHVNAENSIIVVYDWDGKIAAPACALLSEKGVHNAALLHGGESIDDPCDYSDDTQPNQIFSRGLLHSPRHAELRAT